MLRPQVVTEPWNHIRIGCNSPYGGFLSHGAYPSSHPFFSMVIFYRNWMWGIIPADCCTFWVSEVQLAPKNREDGEMSKCQPGFLAT